MPSGISGLRLPIGNRRGGVSGALFGGLREDTAHILGGKLGVLIDEIEADGFAVDDRQGMAELEAGVSLISDVHQAERFGEGLLIAFDGDARRAAVVLASEMPDRLQGSGLIDGFANGSLVEIVLE